MVVVGYSWFVASEKGYFQEEKRILCAIIELASFWILIFYGSQKCWHTRGKFVSVILIWISFVYFRLYVHSIQNPGYVFFNYKFTVSLKCAVEEERIFAYQCPLNSSWYQIHFMLCTLSLFFRGYCVHCYQLKEVLAGFTWICCVK